MQELGEAESLDRGAQVAWIRLNLGFLRHMGLASLRVKGVAVACVFLGEILLRQGVAAAVRPRVVQGDRVGCDTEAWRLRSECDRGLSEMAEGNGLLLGNLLGLVVRAVILVIVKLRPHLFLQMVFALFHESLGRIDFLLQAIAGIVTNVRGWLGGL